VTKAAASLDPRACHRALTAREARFDGVFFVGVSTTGVYCRPICPARTPRADRCTFFARAAEAERAGYRACFRCRPERAPGVASVDAPQRLVTAALAAIDRGALVEASVDALATSLGVSGRHLRRTLERALGVTPIELETTRRLGLAKQLVTDTRMPLTQVALASGFASVRRFHAAFAQRFERTPTAVRAARPGGTTRPKREPMLTLRLDHRPPLDWDALLAFLGPRATPGVERVHGGAYERLVAFDDAAGVLRVRPVPAHDALALEIPAALAMHAAQLARAVRDLFDLDAQPARIGEVLARDRRLARLVRARPGLRVPGALDPFEVAVRIVLAQRVSARAATTFAGRLAVRFGREIAGHDALVRLPPTAARLAAARAEEVAAIGIPRARAAAIVALARAVDRGRVDLSRRTPPRDVVRALRALPGIGPFTAEGIAMRALADVDAFPEGDLVLARVLGRDAVARAEPWRPFRAYGVMHLWTEHGERR
jgi:AraC family transcriptional regulator of adaptative response / DNA-3-methyladenine glycosylase II